ncbi:O-methylsterigmatocystin oxidoreductase [Aspergillus ellipticus CBS 707.79]|uniref:O-methylsterigmatocystin oxidoreductase n=1 Tax=Aspergillus ellipticus CBS 707.79 TaxID=1448320 RepID=A0A319EP09_9EURO|nr:O-methylsterigmatocystin oxidoreductase [Aspergillus ellipticus CBS 707.79]
MSVILQAVVVVVGLFFLKKFLTPKQLPAPLPPGPKPKPIIGNLWDLPSTTERDWVHWHKHRELYGGISSVTFFGKTLIIINDANIAVELMEKRSIKYSERPAGHFPELAGMHRIITTMQYSDPRLRAQRTLFREQVGSNNSIVRFYPVQEAEEGRFLMRVLESPGNLKEHIQKQAAAIVLSITYGYTVEPHGSDPLVELVTRAMVQFGAAIKPGAWIVDSVPFLKSLPTWVPFFSFPRAAKEFKETTRAWSDQPYAFVKKQMAEGTHKPSYVSALVEKDGFPEPDSTQDELIKWTALAFYGAASDTTVATMYALFIALALFPDAQLKAQEEIDRVIGTDRLPVHTDRENLPYINAMVKEALRWHTVAPMGVAHKAKEDDISSPASPSSSSSSFPTSSTMTFTHDPKIYPSPMTFNPDRFLQTPTHIPERDPHFFSFGFGRRVCAGRTLADATLFLNIAQSLAALQIRKPRAADGTEVEIVPDFLPGLISHLGRCELDVRPRSDKHRGLIEELGRRFPFGKGDADVIREVVF